MKPAIAFAVVAVLAAATWADVGPPPGKKIVNVTVEVTANSPLEDFVFIQVSVSTHYAPPGKPGEKEDRGGWRTDRSVSDVHLTPSNPIRATGGRRSHSSLYAVPRSIADSYKNRDELIDDVNQLKITEAAVLHMGGANEIPVTDSRTEIFLRYRAERGSDGKRIEFVQIDEQGNKIDADGSDSFQKRKASWRPNTIHWVAAGTALAIAIAAVGLWLFRRGRNRD